MLYPTINDLTKGQFNRYELSLATAKCARIVTDEYVKQREDAEMQPSRLQRLQALQARQLSNISRVWDIR